MRAAPGSGLPRLGILGGGQLAQMLTLAAVELGVEVAIFEQSADSPAARIAAHEVVGAWTDPAAQGRLLAHADVVTLENEFVDAEVLDALRDGGAAVRPSAATLRRIQDKLVQKQTLAAAGLPVARFASVLEIGDVARAAETLGWPLLLKARRGGYDGYGNALVRAAEEAESACRALGWPARTLLVERFIPFRLELAVIVVR